MRLAAHAGLAVAAALLAACSGNGEALDSLLSVSLERAGGDMAVTYQSAEPVTRLSFRRVAGPVRADRWRVPDGFVLVHDAASDTDMLARVDGRPFRSVTATVPATYAKLPKDYAPFSPFSDGGLLIHSGRFQACADACPEDDTDWSQPMRLVIPDGEHAVVGGEVVRAASANWVEREDGRKIYLGRTDPVDTPRVVAVVDPALPAAVREPLDSLLPRLLDAFAARFGELDTKPELYVSIEPPPELEPGVTSLSAQGGTLPGQVFMHLGGNSWVRPIEDWSDEDLRFLPVFFAHEAAHLFQRVRGADREDDASWIHEGGADALALVVLRDLREIDGAGLDAEVEKRVDSCADGLAEMPLNDAIEQGRFDLHYACGMAVQLAAESEGADLVGVWRDFQGRVKAGAVWDADTFRASLNKHGATRAAVLSTRLSAIDSRPARDDLADAVNGWRGSIGTEG